ncbi:hypothetical protein E6O75_ATG02594 [Venturia nashicola]|uniref:Uncharacterized protein n=1 Tax=Venturia nashicola TaxID=86259 RepID=A0A4Z1PAV5_9PEZI|nr:hypothetical protein E6O75_ATG02594 [Venturia nashicola]
MAGSIDVTLYDSSDGMAPNEELQSIREFLSQTQRRSVSTLREWTQQSSIADRFYNAPAQFDFTSSLNVDALLPEPPQSPTKSTFSSLSGFHFPSTQSTTSAATTIDIGSFLPEPPPSPTKSTFSSRSAFFVNSSQSTTSFLSDETTRSFPETPYAPSTSIPELTSSSTSSDSIFEDTESLEPIPRQGVQLLVPDGIEILENSHHHRPTFQCSFWFLNCSFESPNEEEWNTHCLHHFQGAQPPRSNSCLLCATHFYDFDANESWQRRMGHIADHIRNGQTLATSRPDFYLYKYLWLQRIITDTDYRGLMGSYHLDYAPRPVVLTNRLSSSSRQERLIPIPQTVQS